MGESPEWRVILAEWSRRSELKVRKARRDKARRVNDK
jgi:hypothetical protein